jgi:hypothetical protein
VHVKKVYTKSSNSQGAMARERQTLWFYRFIGSEAWDGVFHRTPLSMKSHEDGYLDLEILRHRLEEVECDRAQECIPVIRGVSQ